jgi:hypothetical protein
VHLRSKSTVHTAKFNGCENDAGEKNSGSKDDPTLKASLRAAEPYDPPMCRVGEREDKGERRSRSTTVRKCGLFTSSWHGLPFGGKRVKANSSQPGFAYPLSLNDVPHVRRALYRSPGGNTTPIDACPTAAWPNGMT